MTDTPEPALPAHLNLLKWLVTILTVVMIVGFIVLITALVIRLNTDPLPMPDRIELPAGTSALSYTYGIDWFAVVTTDNQILIFDNASAHLRQTITID